MNQEVKKKWVDALRSGKYDQCKGSLKGEKGYCCLGVLTDLYLKEKNLDWIEYQNWGTLPSLVTHWAGLDYNNPSIGISYATELNDDFNKTFDEIADLIEKNL